VERFVFWGKEMVFKRILSSLSAKTWVRYSNLTKGRWPYLDVVMMIGIYGLNRGLLFLNRGAKSLVVGSIGFCGVGFPYGLYLRSEKYPNPIKIDYKSAVAIRDKLDKECFPKT
jgi:hypothetical protein